MVEPGRALAGRYSLERLLGEGGMGQVWIARHTALDKLVAIKLMTPAAHASAVLRARFEREARACAALRSPHVVQVFDYGVEDDTPYLVMELLEGDDLAHLRATRPIWPLREVSDVVVQAAKGLAEAHRAGIVHRDIKLGNLFVAHVGGERILKILDFGIAKAFEQDGPRMTGTNVQLGSPSYMSPEQVLSKPVDGRSDLWALAVVAFRLLTGDAPFKAEAPLLVAQKIVGGQRLRPTEIVAGLPDGVDAFFDRALALEPQGRFQSAEEMAAAIGSLSAAHPDAVGRTRGASDVAARPLPATESLTAPERSPARDVSPHSATDPQSRPPVHANPPSATPRLGSIGAEPRLRSPTSDPPASVTPRLGSPGRVVGSTIVSGSAPEVAAEIVSPGRQPRATLKLAVPVATVPILVTGTPSAAASTPPENQLASLPEGGERSATPTGPPAPQVKTAAMGAVPPAGAEQLAETRRWTGEPAIPLDQRATSPLGRQGPWQHAALSGSGGDVTPSPRTPHPSSADAHSSASSSSLAFIAKTDAAQARGGRRVAIAFVVAGAFAFAFAVVIGWHALSRTPAAGASAAPLASAAPTSAAPASAATPPPVVPSGVAPSAEPAASTAPAPAASSVPAPSATPASSSAPSSKPVTPPRPTALPSPRPTPTIATPPPEKPKHDILDTAN